MNSQSSREPPLRVGIAGYGNTGRIRRQHIDDHPRMQTFAVSDITFAEASTAPDGVHCWPDFRQLLDEKPDILFVCITNDIAPEATIQALQHGAHVFCEKPPGRTVSDIRAVREVEARSPGLKLKYGFNHRYHDSVMEAQRIIASGELGTVVDLNGVYGKSKMIRFDADWRTKRSIAGGGILLDQGIHMLDMMRYFAGEFVDVHSFVTNDFWHHDVEDNAYVLMRTADGVKALLHSSATQWRHRFNLIITLTEGALVLSGILSSTKGYGAEMLTVVYRDDDDRGDPREVTTRYNRDDSWRREVFEFADSVLTDKPIERGTSLEALQTMQLVYDIYTADAEWSQEWGITREAPAVVS
jgi:predicted dehydrogenase